MANTVIFDGRNLYDADQMTQHGFYYSSIGRNTVYRNA
jgi:UDPglucose 6-dehydrogenase